MANLKKMFVSCPWPDDFFFFQSEAASTLTFFLRLCSYSLMLAILKGKSCVLLNPVQEFIEKEAWLLLTFFIWLQKQFSSIRSIVTYYRVQMF